MTGFRKALQSVSAEGLAIASILFGYLGIYAFWLCCGWDWGPRFLVPALPGLMALTGLLNSNSRKVLITLTIIGFIVNAPTLISVYERYYWEIETAGGNVQDLSLWTHLLQSPFVNVWQAAFRQINAAAGVDVTTLANALASDRTPAGSIPIMMQTLPVWWWFVPVLGLPVWIGVLAAAGVVTAGIGCLTWGWRLAAAYDSAPQAALGESMMYCTDSRGGRTSSSSK